MKSIRILSASLLCAFAASAFGCASKQPPPELIDARTAYQRAQGGPAGQLNPAGLYEARRSLEAAERKQDDDPGSDQARNMAYVAGRKAQLADANGRTALARTQAQQAQIALQNMEQSQLAAARGQLTDAQRRLQANAAQLDQERNARAEAERRAQQAVESLTAIASVKQNQEGATVITLSGSVLFETGKSDLMPAARQRLDQVAEAMKQMNGRNATVLGFTDSVGSDQNNQRLSQKRAEAVREYLVSRGVSSDAIRAEGRGEQEPVASNATAEGRANNRRVEIVIDKAQGSSGSQGGAGSQGSQGSGGGSQ